MTINAIFVEFYQLKILSIIVNFVKIMTFVRFVISLSPKSTNIKFFNKQMANKSKKRRNN